MTDYDLLSLIQQESIVCKEIEQLICDYVVQPDEYQKVCTILKNQRCMISIYWMKTYNGRGEPQRPSDVKRREQDVDLRYHVLLEELVSRSYDSAKPSFLLLLKVLQFYHTLDLIAQPFFIKKYLVPCLTI